MEGTGKAVVVDLVAVNAVLADAFFLFVLYLLLMACPEIIVCHPSLVLH